MCWGWNGSGDLQAAGCGLAFVARSQLNPLQGSSPVLPVKNEWSENAALRGRATNASNIYCQEIFIANYMHMKQDLVPDLRAIKPGTGWKQAASRCSKEDAKEGKRCQEQRLGHLWQQDWQWRVSFWLRRGMWLLEEAHLNAVPEVLSGGASGWPRLVLRLNLTIRALTWHEAPS